MKNRMRIFLCMAVLLVCFVILSSCRFEEKQTGLQDGVSSNINATVSDENPEAGNSLPSHEHTFGEWNTESPATCQKEGIKTRSCECGYKETETIPITGHRLDTLPKVEPTCQETGLTEGYGCLDCDYAVVPQQIIQKTYHSYEHVNAYPATCTSEGRREGYYCVYCERSSNSPYDNGFIPKLSHTEVIIEGKPNSCFEDGLTEGKYCSVCNTVISEQTVIPKDPSLHMYTYTEEKNPTGFYPGATASVYCSFCNDIALQSKEIPVYEATDHRAYEGEFGYYFLGLLKEGANLQAFYDNLDESMIRFHNEGGDVEESGIVAVIDYSSFGITASQAVTVWGIYRDDHPLYYWIANSASYTGKQLTVLAYEDFFLKSERDRVNALIAEKVIEAKSKITADMNEYEIATVLHDYIAENMEYAYDELGNPEDSAWAHGVSGFAMRSAGVCETYAKTYQLLLNFIGVDNIYLIGDAGGVLHAWNLVRMDDGGWYWFDITWNDSGRDITHTYFCLTDNQPIPGNTNDTFLSTHEYLPSKEYGTNFVYTIPDRSESPYIKEEDRVPSPFASSSDVTEETAG